MFLNTQQGGRHSSATLASGYITLGVSLGFALILWLSHRMWLRKWQKYGVPNHKSIWARLASPYPAWAHVLIWIAITLGLSFYKVHDLKKDYVIVARRFGRVGFYLVPFDILLAIRPSLLSTSYLEYVKIHKWISRYILFLTTMHGVGFFIRWISKGELWAKSIKVLNFLGIVVFFMSLLLTLMSIRPIRRRAYKAFYLIHNITVAMFMFMILFHARPGVTDVTVISMCMLVFQTFQRVFKSHRVSKIEVRDNDLSGLRLLRLPKPASFPVEWSAGAHTRMSFPLSDMRSWLFPSHPYTIVSLPSDPTVDLIIKKAHKFQVDATRDYTITNPFASLSMAFFRTAERVVIICGGSGVSLGLPIFRYLNTNASVHCELHWCVPDQSDGHILENLNLSHQTNVYVTRQPPTAPDEDKMVMSEPGAQVSSNRSIELHSLREEDKGSVDLDSVGPDSVGLDSVGPDSVGLDSVELDSVSTNEIGDELKQMVKFHSGRPVLENIFSSLLQGQDLRNNWIIVCGPNAMVSSAKSWGKQNGVSVFSEFYEF